MIDGYAADEMCSAGRGQLLLPWPNRVRDGRYTFGGETLQLAVSEPAKSNAIHGLTRWSNWTPREQSDSRVTLGHRLHPQPSYPFMLDLSAEYSLSDEGLRVTLRAVNIGTRACPFGAGAHPYLRAGSGPVDDDTLEIPAVEYLTVDEQQIPLRSLPVSGTPREFQSPRLIAGTVLDTGYGGLARDGNGRAWVWLRNERERVASGLWMDQRFPYVMVFTGDTVHPESRRRRGVAVEPMTCAPNAFNSGEGLIVLQPGESFDGSWGIRSA